MTGAIKKSALLFCFILGGCASAPETPRYPVAPAPGSVRSLLMRNPAEHSPYQENISSTPYSALNEAYNAYKPRDRSGIYIRALTRMANLVDRMDDPSIGDIIDRYSNSINKVADRYQKVESFMGSIGVHSTAFREGLGITTAAAATTLGTLHALRPVGVTDPIMGSSVRAGYDVSKLDDPRMLVSYNDQIRVTFSKEGIGGALGTVGGVVYSADLNVKKQTAAASVALRDGLTLGTQYTHAMSEVKGFVKWSF